MSTDPVRIDLSPYVAGIPDEIAARLRGGRRVLSVCHENPEADALGAALAVALFVEAGGGSATPVCVDGVPEVYRFLPGMDRFRVEPDAAVEYDLIVVVDCGELERIGPIRETYASLFESVPIVDIDHHLSNAGFGVVDWIDPGSSATCEMLALLAWKMGVPLSAEGGMLAAALAAGLVMDTGNFGHPNVTPRTMVVAAALREAGADLSDIARRIYRVKPVSQLVLYGRVLARMQSEAEGRVVYSTLESADLAAAAADPSESEGLVDMLTQARGAEVAILFKEGPNDTTRVSVRTREGGVDATALTAAFGGGGHARAAGATVAEPLDRARVLVLARAAELAARVER